MHEIANNQVPAQFPDVSVSEVLTEFRDIKILLSRPTSSSTSSRFIKIKLFNTWYQHLTEEVSIGLTANIFLYSFKRKSEKQSIFNLKCAKLDDSQYNSVSCTNEWQ